MTKNETLAYLAGIVDGEGYIGVKKFKKNKCVNTLYQERLLIRMVDRRALALFVKTFGGAVYPEKQYLPTRRACFVYEAQNRSAAAILRAVLPFLRIKRRQAFTVLRLTTNKASAVRIKTHKVCRSRWGTEMVATGRAMHSVRTLALRERLWLLCKKLNRVGTA